MKQKILKRGDIMKKSIDILSTGNEWHFYFNGKKYGGFSSKKRAEDAAKEMNRLRYRGGGKKLSTGISPKKHDGPIQMGNTRLFDTKRLQKSEWFTLLKKKKKREVADPNRFAFTSYNDKSAEEARNKREAILNNPEIKRNAKKKKIKDLIKQVERLLTKDYIRPEPWRIAKDWDKSEFREAQEQLERQVMKYFLYESYLTFLEGLLKNDKELDSVMVTDHRKYDEYKLIELGHEYYTKEKNHNNYWGQKDKLPAIYDKFEKQLKAEMYGSFSCRDCGTEVSGEDKEDKCKYCEGENFTTINLPRD